jgi:NADP-dependent 3-hydroxy acid dehydrogenase YdfG
VLQRGDRVIATGRSEEKLKALEKSIDSKYHENLRTLKLDVTEGLESLKAKAERAASFWGSVDVLINNAGRVSHVFGFGMK